MAKMEQNFQKFTDETDEKGMLNKMIDEMGFSKYQILLSTITGIILFVGGAQSIMLAILLSLISQKSHLTQVDLAIVNTLESVGYAIATILVNVITEYFQNRRTIQFFTFITLLFTGLSISTYNYYYICATRFFIGFSIGCIDILVYILLIENAPTRIRGFLSSIIFVCFPLGGLSLSTFGYFEMSEGESDRNYNMLLLFPFYFIAFCACIIFFLQESPRKLLSENKVDEVMNTFQKISIFNRKNQNSLSFEQKEIMAQNMKEKIKKNKSIDHDKFMPTEGEPNFKLDRKKTLYGDVEEETHNDFKSKIKTIFNELYFKYTILIWTIIALCSFVFNGIFFMLPTTAPELDRETFKGVLLSVFIEIPSTILTSFLIENAYVGRLRALKIGLFGSILSCSLYFIDLYSILRIKLLLVNCLCKFFINIPVSVLTVYGSEIYSSKIRTFGTSMINFWKRISIISSPLIVAHFEKFYGVGSTFLIFFPFTIIALAFSFFLDVETQGIPLDEFVRKND